MSTAERKLYDYMLNLSRELEMDVGETLQLLDTILQIFADKCTICRGDFCAECHEKSLAQHETGIKKK